MRTGASEQAQRGRETGLPREAAIDAGSGWGRRGSQLGQPAFTAIHSKNIWKDDIAIEPAKGHEGDGLQLHEAYVCAGQGGFKQIEDAQNKIKELSTDAQRTSAILFEDESYIREYQAIKATWFLKGKQKQIKTYGHHAGVGLFGALDYDTGEVMCDTAERLNTQAFEAFLRDKVLPRYEGRHIIMILDNGKIHHARALQPFLESVSDRITFMFLPPYAPRLNRIEGLWRWLKDTVICNAFLKNQSEIHDAVMRFLDTCLADLSVVKKRLCW